MSLIERAEQIAASPMDAAQEIERLTERYDAVRHAYGVEAQGRGRLEQRLRGAVDRGRLLAEYVHWLRFTIGESPATFEEVNEALATFGIDGNSQGGQSETRGATDEEGRSDA